MSIFQNYFLWLFLFCIFFALLNTANEKDYSCLNTTDVKVASDVANYNTSVTLNFFNDICSTKVRSIAEALLIVQNFIFLKNVTIDNVYLHYWPPGADNYNRSVVLGLNNATTFLADFQNFTIITPGWRSPARPDWVVNMAHEFNTNEEKTYNVLSVDWSHYSQTLNYLNAAQYVQCIGKFVGQFLVEFQKNSTANIYHNTHLIGHSLGAHIAGIAGQYVHNKTSSKLAWVTGLDPAAPLFTFFVPRSGVMKLTSADAKFVDIMHTSILLYAYTHPYGKSDFYVNAGGPVQPQCRNMTTLFASLSCSHRAAPKYYSNTINNPKTYNGTKCKRGKLFRTQMGLHVSKDTKGSFYVPTDRYGYQL